MMIMKPSLNRNIPKGSKSMATYYKAGYPVDRLYKQQSQQQRRQPKSPARMIKSLVLADKYGFAPVAEAKSYPKHIQQQQPQSQPSTLSLASVDGSHHSTQQFYPVNPETSVTYHQPSYPLNRLTVPTTVTGGLSLVELQPRVHSIVVSNQKQQHHHHHHHQQHEQQNHVIQQQLPYHSVLPGAEDFAFPEHFIRAFFETPGAGAPLGVPHPMFRAVFPEHHHRQPQLSHFGMLGPSFSYREPLVPAPSPSRGVVALSSSPPNYPKAPNAAQVITRAQSSFSLPQL